MKLLCVILAWRLHAVTLSSEPTERAPPRATLTETVASVADGVIRSTRPPLATAYVGAAARTDWNSTAGPLPQTLSWAGSGRGPRVCASSRDSRAMLSCWSRNHTQSRWAGRRQNPLTGFLTQPTCGAKRNFLKDYWDEKPGETAAAWRGRECARCYLGAPALANVYGPVHEEGVFRMTEGSWQRSWWSPRPMGQWVLSPG